MTRTKRRHRDIGAELRAGGQAKASPRPIRQHRVGSRRAGHGVSRAPISIRRRISTIPHKTNADRKLDSYELHDYEDAISGLRRLQSEPDSLVLAVDGACARNGFPDAQASYGVHVSTRIPSLNEDGLLPVQFPQTSQNADLHAAMQAIEAVHRFIVVGEKISHVVIKTNSEYLERGMSECIWKWTGNGFKNFRGQPVVNGPAFKYLHEKIELLEKGYGIKVSFCKVSKEENERAAWLARLPLRRYSDSGIN